MRLGCVPGFAENLTGELCAILREEGFDACVDGDPRTQPFKEPRFAAEWLIGYDLAVTTEATS